MPFTMTMPKLSPTMEEGTIAKWHKKVGEFVKEGEVLIDVATDKATVEHAVIDKGWLRKIIVPEGGSAIVNQAIAILTEDEKESIEGYQPEGDVPQVQAKPVETSETAQPSVSTAAPAPAAGGLKQPAFVPESPLTDYTFEQSRETSQSRTLASPLARKLAKDKGLDISSVKGTGPNGRVVSSDLNLAKPDTLAAFDSRNVPSIPPGTYVEEPLSPMRKVIGQRLQESKTFIPHFYVTVKINAEPLAQARDQLIAHGVKLTYNDFVVRASSLALRKHPEINSGFNSVNGTIVRFETIDIAIAVSVSGGLITPIIRHADYKKVSELSAEIKVLAQKAKAGKLQPQEYKGGSFTISNLGMYGVDEFIAVINPPQAAILAVSGIQEEPVLKEGHVVPGKTMKLTLSSDHRVIDGATAAHFLNTLKKLLENPAVLLF